MQINDHTEHRKLTAGQLVTDAAGRLWCVAKHRFGQPHGTGPEETWLEHWSDEYAVWMSDDKIACIGDEPLFPLTVVQVVPAPTDAAEQRAQPIFEKVYRFRCPCGAVFEGPAGEVDQGNDHERQRGLPPDPDPGRIALWTTQGSSGDLIGIHLQNCEQGRAVAYVEYV